MTTQMLQQLPYELFQQVADTLSNPFTLVHLGLALQILGPRLNLCGDNVSYTCTTSPLEYCISAALPLVQVFQGKANLASKHIHARLRSSLPASTRTTETKRPRTLSQRWSRVRSILLNPSEPSASPISTSPTDLARGVSQLPSPSSTSQASIDRSDAASIADVTGAPLLPPELLLHITALTPDTPTLTSLSHTSTLLHTPALRRLDALPQSYRIFLPAKYITDRAEITKFLGLDEQPTYHAIACEGSSWFFDVRVARGTARRFRGRWEEAGVRVLKDGVGRGQGGEGKWLEGLGW